MPHIGETFSKRYLFTAETIAAVSKSLGDTNPVHIDAAFAASSRFNGLIASAGHSTGVFVSLLAEHFSKEHEAYGLEFTYKLKRAVPVGLNANCTWRVVDMRPSKKLGGDILTVEGEVTDGGGTVYIAGSGALLVAPKG
jgi:3-hydroxybutyryl-CoA dehydratase